MAVRPFAGFGSSIWVTTSVITSDQRRAPLVAFLRRELRQKAPDRGGDTDGVSSGEHGDAEVGCLDHRLHRLPVARLAHDYGRRPPAQAGAQALGEAREVARHFGGRHQRAVAADAVEDKLDRGLIGLHPPRAALQQPPRARR